MYSREMKVPLSSIFRRESLKYPERNFKREGLFQIVAEYTEGFYNQYVQDRKKDILFKYFHQAREKCMELEIPTFSDSPTGFGGDDPEDAFRHIYTSAIFTRDYGILLGKSLGDLCEFFDWIRGFPSYQMDIHNNNLGCGLGLVAKELGLDDDSLALLVKEAMFSDNSPAIVDISKSRRVRFQDFFLSLVYGLNFKTRTR